MRRRRFVVAQAGALLCRAGKYMTIFFVFVFSFFFGKNVLRHYTPSNQLATGFGVFLTICRSFYVFNVSDGLIFVIIMWGRMYTF